MPPQKSFVATWLFAWLFGYFGIDRFYLGKIGTGILKLITVGGFGLWYLIDVILVLAGGQHDKHGRDLAGYQQSKGIAWVVTIVVWLLGGVSGVLYGLQG
ncbi:TM2 domain-containing protein [Demequina sp.]|uniref:TM2 domain-containing protein n=1 Tax=Demequina sp. TaxID=2050685 RepID=UPI003D096E51